MSVSVKKARADARALRDKLTAEGRHRDAAIIQRIVRGYETATNTLALLHADNMALRDRVTQAEREASQ